MPYLAIECVLFDRERHLFEVERENDRAEHFRILADVTNGTHAKNALLDLLHHDDPKVRTLAAVALFDREDPSVLPALFELSDDQSPTFDGHPRLSNDWLRETGIGPPPLKQTVCDVAGKMVQFYMNRSGFHDDISHRTRAGFQEYWNARKNRAYCAGWFAVQFDRATQGQTPRPKEATPRLRALRQKMDVLPMDDRAWELLALRSHDSARRGIVADAELVPLCKKLGREKLLALLRNEISCDDPDLKPRRSNNQLFSGMKAFVLRRAADLLDAADADTLLAYEKWERTPHGRTCDPWVTSAWPIAAARLAPGRAAQILHDGMARFPGNDGLARANLVAALGQLAGASQLPFIVDWFYDESSARRPFLWRIGGLDQSEEARDASGDAAAKPLVAAIIRDKRFAKLDSASIRDLIHIVNAWSEPPLVTYEEERDTWQGIGHPDDSLKPAVQRKLDELRTRLQASVPTWLLISPPKNDRGARPH